MGPVDDPDDSAGESDRDAQASSAGDTQRTLVVVGVVGLAALAVGLAIVAAVRLRDLDADDPWRPVAADALKTAYQALIIGALGGLLKIWIDQSRRRADERRRLVTIRSELIDGVVHSSHRLDTARTLLRANQSVRTLSDVMTDIVIPARVKLREISHDLRTWRAAKVEVFDEHAFLAVTYLLHRQVRYIDALLDEYAEHKRDLGELQWHAEQAKVPTGGAKSETERDAADQACRERRRKALAELDEGMEALVRVHDFVEGTGGYGEFRSFYFDTLTTLRETVPTGRLTRRETHVPPDWTGIPVETAPARGGPER